MVDWQKETSSFLYLESRHVRLEKRDVLKEGLRVVVRSECPNKERSWMGVGKKKTGMEWKRVVVVGQRIQNKKKDVVFLYLVDRWEYKLPRHLHPAFSHWTQEKDVVAIHLTLGQGQGQGHKITKPVLIHKYDWAEQNNTIQMSPTLNDSGNGKEHKHTSYLVLD